MKINFTGIKYQNNEVLKRLFLKYKKIFYKSDFILRKDVSEFENKVSKFTGAKFVVGLNSGTDALLMSLYASGLKKGDEVITTSHTYVATISSIVHIGCVPVFVDIKNDFNINENLIEKKISKKTKAIVLVHLNGRSCEMNKILLIAKKHKLKIIEDCAQSIGSRYQNKHVGTFGICGCFSLHPMKTLNVAGDGGFVITNNKKINDKIRLLRDHGQRYPKSKNKIICFGFNSRLDNIHAATANIKLPLLNKWVSQRRILAKKYFKHLQNISQIKLPDINDRKFFDTFNSFVILTKNRDKLFNFLLKKKIETSKGLHVGIDRQVNLFPKKFNLPNTRKIEKQILSLPIYPGLKNNEIEYISKQIKIFFKK